MVDGVARLAGPVVLNGSGFFIFLSCNNGNYILKIISNGMKIGVAGGGLGPEAARDAGLGLAAPDGQGKFYYHGVAHESQKLDP